ncbi:DUF2059 domain-containing protein [Micavibrio aeruginosavorus]|uniref:DUF2059 domain-containing protein n=1 Tax=Micavibrio aeruginosavorus EPB TaxID=349215 RepID=M4VFX4_9BACT|nr:DUF2059 domain-containing protein [Micavibrio aeruginosavorus]AGH97390.1 hypothetical protein A11S_566 [Micavibrio aeruginosavorus EPB]
MKKILSLSVLAIMLATTPAMAQTAETTAAAKRYVDAVPSQKMVDEMLDQFKSNDQINLTESDIAAIRGAVNAANLDAVMIDAMAKHFTVDEINALADFYTSATGKSIMKKMPAYMNEVMPTIQKAVMDAVIAEMQKKAPAQ